ncbi:MAG: YicC family protein [Dysgonamonadaceae bacterium]|jgi:uncharacterized protein (TIGR00255 family)|nr:YicC family protein [Dysgonamonadaceae bacterium]
MIQSMTGFGKAEVQYGGRKISVEIKSLNCKQLDIITRIPNAYREKELEIRSMIQTALERGKVELTLVTDITEKVSGLINKEAVMSYFEEIKEIAETLKIDMPADWLSVVLKQPDTTKSDASGMDSGEWIALECCIEKALNNVVNFRKHEGLMLERVFREKISNIKSMIPDIERCESERIEKLKARMKENHAKSDLIEQLDRNRFEQELFYYIERLDISEEKARLLNHLNYFKETLENGESQGRKLNFIAQEIGREINTLGSKSNHAEIQKTVVKMKDELEQIKEQVLNAL